MPCHGATDRRRRHRDRRSLSDHLAQQSAAFNHFQVFGRDFGSQHYIHSIIGLVLLAMALWLWTKAREARTTTA